MKPTIFQTVTQLSSRQLKFFRVLITIFLSGLYLLGCQDVSKKPGLERVLERGYVTVGTLYGPNSYFIDAQGPSGFEYELAKQYADYLGVELRISPSFSLDELFPRLASGEVDFLAAGLSVTDKRLAQFDFSPTYQEISQKLVFKQGGIRPRSIEDLSGVLMVGSNTSHVEQLDSLKVKNPNIIWQETSEFDNEELLLKVLTGEIDYTIVDSHVLAINRRYYPDISIGFTIKRDEKLAWALSKETDDAMLASLIEFFGQVHHDGTLLALADKYYGHVKKFNYVDTQAFLAAIDQTLPDYQPLFEKYADEIDWKLLAAISYQESHWDPRARSKTGVRGMMMLTLPTAKQVGVESRLDPEQSIRGGAKYLRRMIDRIPARIQDPDRIWFALASYNVGFGHVNDARIITEQQGGDPDRWVDVKERLPLLAQKKFYKNTKYGYARGGEPVKYVENIRRYYHTLTYFEEKRQKLVSTVSMNNSHTIPVTKEKLTD